VCGFESNEVSVSADSIEIFAVAPGLNLADHHTSGSERRIERSAPAKVQSGARLICTG